MDFNEFDSRRAADRGAWMHVCSPVDGKPIYLKNSETGVDDKSKPCQVLVYGIEGEVGLGVLEEARTEMVKGKDASVTPSAANAREVATSAPLIGGFQNIYKGKRKAKAPDDCEWFLSLQISIKGDEKSFLEQVREFAMSRKNQLKNG